MARWILRQGRDRGLIFTEKHAQRPIVAMCGALIGEHAAIVGGPSPSEAIFPGACYRVRGERRKNTQLGSALNVQLIFFRSSRRPVARALRART